MPKGEKGQNNYGVGKANKALDTQFTRAAAGIAATRKLYKRDRMSEYKATQSLTRSLYGNALGTLGGVAKNMTADQKRQLAALKRVTSGKAERRISNRAADTVRNLYGIAGTGFAGPALDTLAATAKGAHTTLQGQRKAGGILAESNDAAMSTLAAGLKESSQGAKAAVANALLYRAKNDASLISDRKTALAQERIQAAVDERNARLQAELDYKNWQKQQDYINKQVGADGTAVAGVAGDAWTGLRTISNLWYDDQGNSYHTSELDPESIGTGHPTTTDDVPVQGMTAGQAAAQYAGDQGYAIDSPEGTVIAAVARSMWNAGAGVTNSDPFNANQAAQIRSSLTSSLGVLYPHMPAAKMTALIEAQVKAASSAAAANSYNGPADPGAGGGSPGGGGGEAVAGTAAVGLAGAQAGYQAGTGLGQAGGFVADAAGLPSPIGTAITAAGGPLGAIAGFFGGTNVVGAMSGGAEHVVPYGSPRNATEQAKNIAFLKSEGMNDADARAWVKKYSPVLPISN